MRIEAAQPEERSLETDLYRIRIGNHGGVILGWQLKKYNDDAGQPLELVSPGSAKTKRFPLALDFADPGLTKEVGDALFKMDVEANPDRKGTRVSLHYSDGKGLEVRKTLELSTDSYVTRVEIVARQLIGEREAVVTIILHFVALGVAGNHQDREA